MKAVLAFLALGLASVLVQPASAQSMRMAAVDAPPATVAAPPEMSPPSTATPAALSAPAISTTPDGALPATAPSGVTPPIEAASAAPLPTPLEAAAPPPPEVQVTISLSKQRMVVSVAGKERYAWPVSTARKGYRTPLGTYRPERMHKRYFSRKYDNAPMPYAIFFHRGWAIHGTDAVGRLGRPASHGCVRLHPSNARALFALVSEHGRANTQITVSR